MLKTMAMKKKQNFVENERWEGKWPDMVKFKDTQ